MGLFRTSRSASNTPLLPKPPGDRRRARPRPLYAPNTAPKARAYTPAPAPRVSSPFSTHRSLTAAATIVDLSTDEARSRFNRRRSTAEAWQSEAWMYFDNIGEIKYALGLVANTLSRVRLYAGHITDPALTPTPASLDTAPGAASMRALDRLSSAFGGIPGLLRDAALNLQVTGECNLVQIPANSFAGTPESWDIRSTDELKSNPSGQIIIQPTSDGAQDSQILLPPKAFLGRIWRPHPRYSDESDSSLRSLLDNCAELLLLNKTFRSTARSRLNSGLLYLPDGISAAHSSDAAAAALPAYDPDNPDTESEFYDPDMDSYAAVPPSAASPASRAVAEEAEDDDEFEEAFIEAMTTPIADEESASAVVPLVVRGPAELGEKIRYIQFERSFDPALAERADRVLDRIMQGLDVPKDIVQGLSNIRYSNAIVIDQSLYTSHIEPLALLICDALTTIYLRPSLRAAGISAEEARNYVIWYDASDVTTRPNRADDADKGFALHAVNFATWRRAHNFTEEDAPSPDEIAIRAFLDKGPITPELSEALLGIIAPDIMKKVREASQAASPAPLPQEVVDAIAPTATPDAADTTPTRTPPPSPPPAAPDPDSEAPATPLAPGPEAPPSSAPDVPAEQPPAETTPLADQPDPPLPAPVPLASEQTPNATTTGEPEILRPEDLL